MIRWRYLVPRLVLVGALGALVWFGLNPLVRRILISAGQNALSAKVAIDRVEVSLRKGELCLRDVAAANPTAPDKNLFEATQVALRLDTDALWRRKFVVREGRITGLRLGARRDESGALDPCRVKLRSPEWEEAACAWLDQLAGLLQQELVEQAEQLESARLAAEMLERWPAEYERLQTRAENVRQWIATLQELSNVGRQDPTRLVAIYQQTAADLVEVQREIAALEGEVRRLGDQVLVDKDALLAAKDRDLERIRATLRLENLRAESLTEYLLGPELGANIVALIEWIEWGRRYLPREIDDLEPVRARGVDVSFAGADRQPRFLIESLLLDGTGTRAGRPFKFLATASGVASEPELYGKPVVVKAQIQSGALVQIEAVLDRTTTTPCDRITLNCPNWQQPERVLGRPGRLALRVAPGNTHLWASLERKGDELSGRLLLQQGPVELTPELAEAYGGPRLAARLEQAARDLREIRVVVDLAGTADGLDWEFRSNLGPQLAASLKRALETELETRREELLVLARQRAAEGLARIDAIVAAKRDELLERLQLDGREMQNLHQALARRIRLPETLGNGLPETLTQGLSEGSPFRFR